MSTLSRAFFRMPAALNCLACTLFVITALHAQSTGTIQGTVTDASGAAIPMATVTIHNQNTGEERTTTTDSAGLYAAPSLPAGTYRIEVKASGMATTTATNL